MPLITLTTDFGTQDGYVGAMKGYLLREVPQLQIIDISHDISPQHLRQAAWCIYRSSPQFPAKTIHIIVVDPAVGSLRHPLLVLANAQIFIAPDNGILSFILNRYPPTALYRLHRQTPWWQAHPSFDGLALFSPAAACVANGIPFSELGTITDTIEQWHTTQPIVTATQIIGEITDFDRFGNAISNISAELIANYPAITHITCREKMFIYTSHYAAASTESGLALINSDGFLELAIYSDSAQRRYQLNDGDKILIKLVATDR